MIGWSLVGIISWPYVLGFCVLLLLLAIKLLLRCGVVSSAEGWKLANVCHVQQMEHFRGETLEPFAATEDFKYQCCQQKCTPSG